MLRIHCIAYNSSPGELKILCEEEGDAVEDLSSLIREYGPGEISDAKVEEGVVEKENRYLCWRPVPWSPLSIST